MRWFHDRLGIEVIGTDISETAVQFGLVEWDFHNPRADWIGQFDFVYTNSHDHAFDPPKAFATWVDQLSPTGRLIVEHSTCHSPTAISRADPFGVEPKLLPYLMLKFSSGSYSTREVIVPDHKKRGSPIWLFVIQKN